MAEIKFNNSKRNKSIYWAMLIILGGATILTGLPGLYHALFKGSSNIGVVNGIPVTLAEYRMSVVKEERLLAAYREQFGSRYHQVLSLIGKSENVENTVRDQIVLSKLLLMLAQDLPLKLHSAYITRELGQPRVIYGVLGEVIPPSLFTEHGVLRPEAVQMFLRRQGSTLQEFEQQVEQFLLSQWAIVLAHGATTVSHSAEQIAAAQKRATKKYRVDVVDIAPYLADERVNRTITEDEIQHYYNDINDVQKRYRYWTPERRSGTVYTFNVSDFAQYAADGANESEKKKAAPSNDETFMSIAQQAILGDDEKVFSAFLQEHRAKKTSLNKVFLNADGTAPEVTLGALFQIGRAGERMAATLGVKGFIVELGQILPREHMNLEEVRGMIIDDIKKDRASEIIRSELASGVSSGAAGQKKQRLSVDVELSPLTKDIPAELRKVPLTIGSFNGLLFPGQERTGSSRTAVYRIVTVNSELPNGGTAPELFEWNKKLSAERGELLLRNLIASLQERAILSTWTVGTRTTA